MYRVPGSTWHTCVCVCVWCIHAMTYLWKSGTALGSGFLIALCGSQVSNSDPPASRQALLCTEPSHQPLTPLFMKYYWLEFSAVFLPWFLSVAGLAAWTTIVCLKQPFRSMHVANTQIARTRLVRSGFLHLSSRWGLHSESTLSNLFYYRLPFCFR